MGNEQSANLVFDGTPLPGMTVDFTASVGDTVSGQGSERDGQMGGVKERGILIGPWVGSTSGGSGSFEDGVTESDSGYVAIRRLGEVDVAPSQRTDTANSENIIMASAEGVSIASAPRRPFSCSQEEACFASVKVRAKEIYMEHRQMPGDTAELVDGKGLDKLMRHESYILGFLQVATKCKGPAADWANLDVEAVANQICSSLEYRIDRGIRRMKEWPPLRTVRQLLPGGFYGKGTQEGRPMYWMMASLTDWSNLDKITIERAELQVQELLSETLTDTGHRDALICVNLEGLGKTVVQHYGKFQTMATVSEKYYPGRAYKTLCVNGSALVTNGYNMLVRPFLSYHTQGLVIMCEKGQATLVALQRFMKNEEIPRCYGGGAEGTGSDDFLLESKLFPEGLNPMAEAFKMKCIKNARTDLAAASTIASQGTEGESSATSASFT